MSKEELRHLYDEIYARLSSCNLLDEIIREAMKHEAASIPGQFSFLKHTELRRIDHELSRCSKIHNGLDLGCGLGGLTNYLAERHGGNWIGLDCSFIAVAAASRGVGHKPPSFLLGDLEKMPFADETLDCVVAIDSLQHASSFERCADELSRILVPDGLLLFTRWTSNLPDRRIAGDPLHRALLARGFSFVSLEETDLGLDLQIAVYRIVYERRAQVRDELGSTLLDLMYSEAKHLIQLRDRVGRYLVIAQRVQRVRKRKIAGGRTPIDTGFSRHPGGS